MKRQYFNVTATIILLAILTCPVLANKWYANLAQDGTYGNFVVDCIYLDGRDKAVGSRMIHTRSGFTMDIFQIQSEPQAFVWVNTFHDNDQGEPHACEHLLLGKGTKGRYVANLENMALGRSTAWTSQLYTCYPFSSAAGMDVFYLLLDEKLDALINPNFTAEEIHREVFNVGYDVDQTTGELNLGEKGTIYAEMITYSEYYWNYFYDVMDRMIFGETHPKAAGTGGYPDAIREMTAEDMRKFHGDKYRLNNMGMVVAFPVSVEPMEYLARVDEILSGMAGKPEGTVERNMPVMPPPQPSAPPGETRLTYYPGMNEQDPGYIMYGWPADLKLSVKEKFLVDAFLSGLANTQTSNLYNKFINSDTRVIDIGTNNVWAGADDEIGHTIKIGLANVTPENISLAQLKTIKQLVLEEIEAVSQYQPGSPELDDFNSRIRSNLIQNKKSADNILNSPPGFGQRGGSGLWYFVVSDLERLGGFKRSLVYKELYGYAFEQLDMNTNIWAPLIAKCNLLDIDPYAVGCKADPSMQAKAVAEKEARLAGYSNDIMEKYGTDDKAKAFALYRDEYDKNTKAINDEVAKIEMPKFIDNPPMTIDPQLEYAIDKVNGTSPMLVTDFNSITSTSFCIYFNLRAVPKDKLIYSVLLPELITEIGVVKDGEIIGFASLSKRLQNEVLSLNSFVVSNATAGRVELAISGSGSNPDENKKVIEWIRTGLFNPYLSPDNLPRIRDIVSDQLTSLRKRTETYEEYWVGDVSNGYRYQEDALLMNSFCFLTQEHFMHRLKWRFTDAGGSSVERSLQELFPIMASIGSGKTKESLYQFASSFSTSDPSQFENGSFAVFADAYGLAPAGAQDIIQEALSDLALILPTIPEENAAEDWTYLCNQMSYDLFFRPEKALEELGQTLGLLRNQNLARMYIVSNSEDRQLLYPDIESLIQSLDTNTPELASYENTPVILNRIKGRYGDIAKSSYVGYVHEESKNGVFMFSANSANYHTTDEMELLDYLSGKLYGGGGSHSIFMKTWGAGLAYSNGLRSVLGRGRISYYAERCPVLTETMQFVVNELKGAPYDPKLAEYAIALVFGINRGANSYGSRAAAMAADLTDGITPEVVSAFRQRIIDIRDKDNLYDLLHKGMKKTYGKVLIGYGDNLAKNEDGIYFIIGPSFQLKGLEEFIASTEGEQKVYKVYPRDFWIVD